MSATVFTPAPAVIVPAVIEPEVVEDVCQCPGPYHECPYSSWCSCDRRRCSRCEYQPGFSRLTLRVLLADMTDEDYISDGEVQSYYDNLVVAYAEGASGC